MKTYLFSKNFFKSLIYTGKNLGPKPDPDP